MNSTRKSSYSEAASMNKEQLISLLKEIKIINKLDVPRLAKKSKGLKYLLNLEKESYNEWWQQFSNVKRAVEIEILHRISKDNW